MNLLLIGLLFQLSSEPGAADAKAPASAPSTRTIWTHPKVEARGVWIPRDSMEPDAKKHETPQQARERMIKSLDALKAANFNILLIDGWFKGYTAYPGSKVAPQYPAFRENDMFGFVFEEGHKRGFQIQPWLGYGFYAYYTPDASKDRSMGTILDAHPELAAVDSKGNRGLRRDIGTFYSLCPSNPESHEILGEILVEMIMKYPADGVHLDRIRYPESNYCYCDYCKTHFKEDTGLNLTESTDVKTLLDWRREQTAKAAGHFEKVIHTARPGLPITAYVLSPQEMNSKAQGWDLWVKRGYVDAVAVSMYGADIRNSATEALALLGVQRAKLICAISCEHPTSVYVSNVQIARDVTAMGQFTWWLGKLNDDLVSLKTGPYASPAQSPFP